MDERPAPPVPGADPPTDLPRRERPRARGFGFYAGAALCALFLVRTLGSDWNSHFKATWPDALFPKEGYLPVALVTPFRPQFYFAFRPIAYPTLLWVFGRSSHLTVIAQSVLYCATVLALCATAWEFVRSRVVAWITIVVLVGVTVQPKFSMWNTQILSESLSISLGYASIAAWWRFAAVPTCKRAVWGFAFVIAWSLVRDSNVIAAFVVVVPVALGVALLGRGLGRELRRVLAIGAAALVLTTGYSYISQGVSHRADLQFQDLVGVRILPDATLSDWFVAHGMPLDDALRARSGKAGFVDTFWRSKDPAFANYFHWSKTSGRRLYLESLFARSTHYRALFYKDLREILADDMSYYDTHGVHGRLYRTLPLQLGGPSTRKGLTVWLILAVVAMVVLVMQGVRERGRLRLAVFCAAGLATSLALIFLSWFGEPLEVSRHAIGGVCALSVFLVVTVANGVDAALDAMELPPKAPTRTAPQTQGEDVEALIDG